GFPAHLLAEGPSRFRTGSKDRAGRGHGLGLPIVAGQARMLGARPAVRHIRPAGAPDDVPARGAGGVLGPPEPAPSRTAIYPALPDRERAPQGAARPVLPR